MTEERFKNYLYDLGNLLKKIAREAKVNKDKAIKTDIDYKTGYLMGLHEAVSLMKQQAEAFNIRQEELGLDDIEPEVELL